MTTGAPLLASPRPSPHSLYPRVWSLPQAIRGAITSLRELANLGRSPEHKTPVFLHYFHTPRVPQYAARQSLAPASPVTVPATEVYKHEGPRPENRFSLHRPFSQRPTSPDSLRRNPRPLPHTAHFQQPHHRNQYVSSSPSPSPLFLVAATSSSSLLAPSRLNAVPHLPRGAPPRRHAFFFTRP